jgi:hypothetical protein
VLIATKKGLFSWILFFVFSVLSGMVANLLSSISWGISHLYVVYQVFAFTEAIQNASSIVAFLIRNLSI